MGTLSTKFIINASGLLTEQASVKTTAGVADANKLIALNDTGVIDPTIVNAKNTSTGAADAAKIPQLNANGVLDSTITNATGTSAGAGSSGKLVALDGSGRIDSTMMPVGVGSDTYAITTSEALTAGDYVNVWNSAGPKVRKADATTAGKEAHGYVLTGVASGATATVYFEATNTSVTGQTAGVVFLSTTAGQGTTTPPTTAGNIIQRIGFAVGTTAVNFQSQPPILLA